MAEERVIDEDEDKNKKFIIRKNADGEDELVYIGVQMEGDDEPAYTYDANGNSSYDASPYGASYGASEEEMEAAIKAAAEAADGSEIDPAVEEAVRAAAAGAAGEGVEAALKAAMKAAVDAGVPMSGGAQVSDEDMSAAADVMAKVMAKKFDIRKNADGEDELVYVGGELETDGDTDEAGDVVTDLYEVPEFEEDDEEAAVMTPEQLAERDKRRAEEKEKKQKQAAELLEKALQCMEGKDFGGAVYSLSLAEEQDPESTTIKCEKYRAACKDFTDFEADLDEIAAAAQDVGENCTPEEKADLLEKSSLVKEMIAGTEQKLKDLAVENEAGKKEREEIFVLLRRRAVRHVIMTAVPFAVFLILTVCFIPFIYSNEQGVFLILMIVFACIAFVFLVASFFTLHALVNAQHKVKLNEKNSSTKVGRLYEETENRYNTLRSIYEALGGTYDIS
ncbi:MAG: hypothetical protein LUE27_06205 [Clostridia bacterium]|nr:hypothetical protein [Clostridia bacterium]